MIGERPRMRFALDSKVSPHPIDSHSHVYLRKDEPTH